MEQITLRRRYPLGELPAFFVGLLNGRTAHFSLFTNGERVTVSSDPVNRYLVIQARESSVRCFLDILSEEYSVGHPWHRGAIVFIQDIRNELERIPTSS